MRGGKRPGAGRKKGATKLLPEQAHDLFLYIEGRCARLQSELPARFGHGRVVRMICARIARKADIKWVDRTGRIVARCGYSATALANIYYQVRKRRSDGDAVKFGNDGLVAGLDERGYMPIARMPVALRPWLARLARTTVMLIDKK
jgi:hypothetical protein